MGDDPSVFFICKKMKGIKEFVTISIIFLAVLLAIHGKEILPPL
jgi:hypothetical protein